MMRGVERCHLTSPRLCETSHAERAGYALPRGAWERGELVSRLSPADALRQLPSSRHLHLLRFCLLRLIRQARGQPALHFSHGDALASSVVFDLVAGQGADVVG